MFSTLSMTRRYGQAGMQPLQVSEIASYLSEVGLRGHDREVYLHMVLGMDQEYMAFSFEKNKPSE